MRSPYEAGLGFCARCRSHVVPLNLRCPRCGGKVRMGARLMRKRRPIRYYEVIDYGDGVPRCGNCRCRLQPSSATLNNRLWRCSNEECGYEVQLDLVLQARVLADG